MGSPKGEKRRMARQPRRRAGNGRDTHKTRARGAGETRRERGRQGGKPSRGRNACQTAGVKNVHCISAEERHEGQPPEGRRRTMAEVAFATPTPAEWRSVKTADTAPAVVNAHADASQRRTGPQPASDSEAAAQDCTHLAGKHAHRPLPQSDGGAPRQLTVRAD